MPLEQFTRPTDERLRAANGYAEHIVIDDTTLPETVACKAPWEPISRDRFRSAAHHPIGHASRHM